MKLMTENKMKDGCACTQGLIKLLRTSKPKKNPLISDTCCKCGEVFLTNSNKEC